MRESVRQLRLKKSLVPGAMLPSAKCERVSPARLPPHDG